MLFLLLQLSNSLLLLLLLLLLKLISISNYLNVSGFFVVFQIVMLLLDRNAQPELPDSEGRLVDYDAQ